MTAKGNPLERSSPDVVGRLAAVKIDLEARVLDVLVTRAPSVEATIVCRKRTEP